MTWLILKECPNIQLLFITFVLVDLFVFFHLPPLHQSNIPLLRAWLVLCDKQGSGKCYDFAAFMVEWISIANPIYRNFQQLCPWFLKTRAPFPHFLTCLLRSSIIRVIWIFFLPIFPSYLLSSFFYLFHSFRVSSNRLSLLYLLKSIHNFQLPRLKKRGKNTDDHPVN